MRRRRTRKMFLDAIKLKIGGHCALLYGARSSSNSRTHSTHTMVLRSRKQSGGQLCVSWEKDALRASN